MALFTLDQQIDINTDNINEDIKTPVFNSDTISDDIIKQISGYKWYINYYNLISDITNNQTTIDFSVDLPTTEYNLIKDMVITLDTPISTDIAVNMTGSGYINAGIIPKNGDVFLAKLIDGRLGVFSLTGVNRKNYNLKDIFLIDFKLYTIITDNTDIIYQTLLDKTVNTLIYNKDYLSTSDKQLYTSQEYDDRITIKKYLKLLVTFYNTKIVNINTKFTISYLTDLSRLVYDPNIEYFVKEVLGLSNLPERVNLLGKKDDSINTILDMILVDTDMVLINEYIKIVLSNVYGLNPFTNPIYWSGISDIVTTTNTLDINITDNDVTNNVLYPYISNTMYIFNNVFYDYLTGVNTTETLTLLETMVLDIVNKRPIKISDIKSIMYDLMNSDNKKEQYYYIPILIYSLMYYNNQITYSSVNG